MGTYSTEAVILRARDFGEADRLLTLFTLAEGKVTAKVRGARKAQSRLAGATLPLTHVQVMLWRGRSEIETLTQAVALEAYSPLREDLWRLAQASLAVELVDLFCEERAALPETFVALLQALALIAYGESPETGSYSLALRLIRAAGLLAPLDRCVSCGIQFSVAGAPRNGVGPDAADAGAAGRAGPAARAGPTARAGPVARAGAAARAGPVADPAPVPPAGWSSARSGPLCPGCAEALETGVLPLRPDAWRAMEAMLTGEPPLLRSLRLDPGAEAQIRSVLGECVTYHLDRRPKSLEFLDTVARARGRP